MKVCNLVNFIYILHECKYSFFFSQILSFESKKEGVRDMQLPEHPVILFDGVCNLCNGAVQWVIRHDRNATFRFASLQSIAGQRLLANFQVDAQSLQSIVLIENNRVYLKSTAVLRIFRKCNRLYPILYAGICIPRVLRDWLYTYVALHRYQWFGQQDVCMIPKAEWRSRFLDEPIGHE